MRLRISRPVRPLRSRKGVNMFETATERGGCLGTRSFWSIRGRSLCLSSSPSRWGRRARRRGSCPSCPRRMGGCHVPEPLGARRTMSGPNARHAPSRSHGRAVTYRISASQFGKLLQYASPLYSELGILDNLKRPRWSQVLERLYRDKVRP